MILSRILHAKKKSIAFGIGGKGNKMYKSIILALAIFTTLGFLFYDEKMTKKVEPTITEETFTSIGIKNPCLVIIPTEVSEELVNMGILQWVEACNQRIKQ